MIWFLKKLTALLVLFVFLCEFEFLSYNMIASLPIIGKSRPIKQYIGIGDTMFNIKLVLDENNEKDIATLKKLKNFI